MGATGLAALLVAVGDEEVDEEGEDGG